MVAFIALNLALALCGVRLWKSVRKLTGGSIQDDADGLVEEFVVPPVRKELDSDSAQQAPITPEPIPAPAMDTNFEEDVDGLDPEEEESVRPHHAAQTIDEWLESGAHEPVRPRPIRTITLKQKAERESDHNRTPVNS